MGTRADFYVGQGPEAEWLGSVAWDGYEWADETDNPIRQAKTEEEYRKAVSELIAYRDDGTKPEMGWPWPWDDSGTTDFAYFWDGSEVKWEWEKPYPDMKARKNVTMGDRSGLMMFRAENL